MDDISNLPPSKRNKLFASVKNSGKCLITTIVSGVYQWYVPMFIDRIKKECPECDVLVYIRGKPDSDFPDIKEVICGALPEYPGDGYTTAALRFVYDDSRICAYDYVLITDIDMMIMGESISIVDQHMLDLRKNDLRCYSNYASSITATFPRLPGVHFVTKDWWEKTREVRNRYSEYLKENGAGCWYYDEVMLHKIVQESGLKINNRSINMWCHHGVHLGDYRRSIQLKESRSTPDAFSQMYIRKMLGDEEFMKIVAKCSEHIPSLSKTFDMFRQF